MATLLIKSDVSLDRVIKLKLGTNRLGRAPENDFQIEHPTISATHCEVELAGDQLIVRDCGSTNGTFIDGQPVQEAPLYAGQYLRLGEVELLAETAEAAVAIPRFTVERPAPPVMLDDGSLLCPRHPQTRTTHRCTRCREVLCDRCVRRLRRHGGKTLKLCPTCSYQCEPVIAERPRKKSLLDLLHQKIKLPLSRAGRQKRSLAYSSN